MKVSQRVTRKIEIGEPEWVLILLDYWESDNRLGLNRRCKSCGKRHETGHVSVCHFKTGVKQNMLICENCRPISEEELTTARKRAEKQEASQ